MQWRKITAETYRTLSDPIGYDEAYVTVEETGEWVEIWDCCINHDDNGNVVLILARGDYAVPPSYMIEVR